MWFSQIVDSLRSEDFSEELLQDITNHLQQIRSGEFRKGYEEVVWELSQLGIQFIEEDKLPSAQLVIKYLQHWNADLCMFQNAWALLNLEISYSIKLNKLKSLKNKILTLMEEQHFYALGAIEHDVYQMAYTNYLYTFLEPKCKQQAVQAILKLQQLLIQTLEPQFSHKVHMLMAKVYAQLGAQEKGVHEANQYFRQAIKTAQQVLSPNDPFINYMKSLLKEDQQLSQPPKPMSLRQSQAKDQDIQLDEKHLILGNQMGTLRVLYNIKKRELQFQFCGLLRSFNLSDVQNEIEIYHLQPLPVFLQEFVEAVMLHLEVQELSLEIENKIFSLFSYDKRVQLIRKSSRESLVFFTDQIISRHLSDYQEDESIHPLLSEK